MKTQRATASGSAGGPGGSSELPVLLVEPYLPLAKPLIVALTEEGIVTHLARESERATALVRATRYAAVLIDWKIPPADGFDLLRRWRQGGLDVPALLLVPSLDRDLTSRAEQAGADGCLPLPFPIEDLLARLRLWASP